MPVINTSHNSEKVQAIRSLVSVISCQWKEWAY